MAFIKAVDGDVFNTDYIPAFTLGEDEDGGAVYSFKDEDHLTRYFESADVEALLTRRSEPGGATKRGVAAQLKTNRS